ncbi:retrovirus-related Pol polyprotein from transposon opus [Trichonephila clavipes]|uniref:RNA-directed DNA polymerase n=1 Tax=Trichonephila clavipes TaxID=2585209 RepID=A0A8X6T3H2_TRICX|nr:retrovirus-related Pol polyprotein from transposon opus [Trichonephila clavipes]
MTPVELPYVPILLNETFITALWDTGAEKSFISEEVYRNYFSYRPRQKTKDRVVTAQGAPCSHLGRVELQIRIREFQKPWEFHILDNMQYQCILGIDFMKASRLTLDFDQKSLIIPDHLIKQTPKEEKLVDIDLTESKLDDEQQRQLKALFNNFKGLFSDQPGLTHVVYHEIDTGDKGPVVSRPYKYDRVKQGIIDYHIDKMLRDGTICPINSPYASPVVLTRKNNDLPPDSPEAYRFAIDYRKLNGITKYPRYPLPVIDDLLTNIPHTNVMSTLDLRSGYFQLAISPKDIEKTAFITRNGTFAFLRMPFGLSGAAPNFQRAIDIILKPVIGRFVSVYMDDVIITSPSFKDHLDHLTRVFTLLRDAGLTLNKEKCHFARDKLKYLGLIISKEGIETDNKKIRAITEMKPPKNNREVSKFLGMTEAQDSFDQIKRTLTEAPILQLPNFSEQFNLFTDASGVGIGAVLQQNQKPIAFASRTLNKAERNYTVTERECLAVIWALNKFKTYFGPLPVKVITDHAALTLTNGKNLSSRMIRWALKLSEFNIEWEHRPGVQNVVADLLSRNPVDSVEGSQISCAALRALAINSREQFIKEQREDPELGHIYRYLENPDDGSVNATVCESWSQDFKLINGLLFYAKYFSNLGELRVYIPGSLRKDIMKEFHDLPLAGHLGKRKTYLKLRDTCYFPFMRKYIFEYVSTCDRCQKFNYKNALPAGRLMPIVSKYPNEIVTLDLLGPYPASRPERYKFILVITDHFTKWCELIPLRKASAQAITNAFFDNYIARYGAPISLISDNGPQFISDVFEHLSHRLDIKHMKTVTYRPQSNLTERVNRNLVQMIASFVEENHENWDQFLHEFAFALRTAVNETTNKTPAELFLGRKIITPFSKLINVTEDAKYVGSNIERLFDEARRNMQKKNKSWEKHYNLRRRDVHIKVNDLVLLQTHFLSATDRKQVGKFMPKFEGPYKVLEIKGNNLVIWKNGRNITVNIDQVRVYRPRQSDTISSDSPVETLYDEQEVSHGSNRSHQGQFKEHRKTSSQERPEKTRAPEQGQGVKRSIPSSFSSKNYKFQKHNTSSPGVKSIAGPSKLPDRRTATTTSGSRMEVSGRDNQTRQTRATTRRRNEQAEKPVRSNQTNTRRPCPYYLRSRIQEKDGIHEELSNIEINGIPGSTFRRRSLSMEALNGDPVHRI